MKSVTIAGETRRIGESQGYLGLSILDTTIECTVNGPDTPAMITAWIPTHVELARIEAGAPVLLRILGVEHPPVMLEVGPVQPQPPTGGDAPQLLEKEFRSFAKAVEIEDAGEVQLREMRRAFFAGARSYSALMMRALDPEEGVTDADLALMEAMEIEMSNFARDVVAGRK